MLAARAQTMTSVIDAVTEQSIIGTDRDGVIRVWNPGAEKMLGLPRADVVRTRSIVEFHLPEELEAAAEEAGSAAGLAALVRAAQENGSDVRDWTYVAADGQQRTVSVAITPRTDDAGAHAGWNFVGTDMTEARATERMKDQFVSLISHELRTPLSSILGYLELVLDDEEQHAHRGAAHLPGHRRAQRRTGCCAWSATCCSPPRSRPAASRCSPRTSTWPAWCVPPRRRRASTAATGGRRDPASTCPTGGLVVPGDAVRLGQACDNLVSNAVKFTPSGGRVTLSLRGRPGDSRTARSPTSSGPGAVPVAQLAVSDTGVGIPAGEQGKLFTRFFRASTAQRNAVPGVGLGLTITKAITTAHGGTLDVRQRRGPGHDLHPHAACVICRPPDDTAITLSSSGRHRGHEPSPAALSRCVTPARTPSGGPLGATCPCPTSDVPVSCGFLADGWMGDVRYDLQIGPCRRERPADTDTGRTDMTSKNRTIANSSTARKVVGSLGVLGTAAAVAGMGTFGNFTDSTTPVATTIQSGTLSIDLSQPGYAVPVTTTGFVPGDSMTRAVNLVNDGNSALGSVTLASSATASSVLTTDTTNGLQLTVKKCSVAWTQGGTASAPPTPARAPRPCIGSGPVVNNMRAERRGGAERRWHRLPDVLDLAAGLGRQHLPGQVRVAEPDLHGHPAHRHRPLTGLTT